jgi:hypothetical protein
MDLRSVRDRLLGRADAGAAARASQAFFLRGRLDAGKEKASNMGSCAHNATHIIFLFIFFFFATVPSDAPLPNSPWR